MNKTIICLTIVLLFSPLFNSYGKIIKIKNQTDFDHITEKIKDAINSSGDDNDIIVKISPGIYTAREQHIYLVWIKAPEKRIKIIGHKTVIVPQGNVYKSGDDYAGVFSYNNSLMSERNDISIWSSFRYANGLIEITDKDAKKCRLKTEGVVANQLDCLNTYILIPEWCQTSIYKVDDIEKDYIYFKADNLKISYNNGYIVNDDYNYGRKQIRFKLCNSSDTNDIFRIENNKVYLPKGVNYVREGLVYNYITVQSSAFKSIELSGIELRGNSFNNSKPAIFFCDTSCDDVFIHNCSFRGMHGTVISVESTYNVRIKDNDFLDCHYNGIYSDNSSKGTIITDNTFTRMGKRMQCSFCITCKGEDYYVANNVLCDFGYGGIGVGVWHGANHTNPSRGVVENNELYYTSNYLNDVENNAIMDGGAIYIWTINDGAIIRNNSIHDISGIKDNRGIFCDDGARNFQIYGNVITNIHNSYCIDSRRVSSMESSIGPTNVNNFISENIIDGSIRFQGNEKKSGCKYGTNYRLVEINDNDIINDNISNVSISGDMVSLQYLGSKRNKIVLSKKDFKQLRRSSSGWKDIKRYVTR